MKQKTLFRIALICSLAGIFILMIFADNIKIEESQINELDQKGTDEEVIVKGTISKITEKEGLTIIEITKKETLPIIIFDNLAIGDIAGLSAGDYIEVRGKVQEFMEEKEVIGDSIRKI